MSNLEINAGLKYSGIDLNTKVNKLPPQGVIVIGSLLVVYGLYLYLNQEKKATNC